MANDSDRSSNDSIAVAIVIVAAIIAATVLIITGHKDEAAIIGIALLWICLISGF